jgi:hypothetical protein
MPAEIDVDSLVRIARPRYPVEGSLAFQDKLATVIKRDGTALSLVMLGEEEAYTFWVGEVDLVAQIC